MRLDGVALRDQRKEGRGIASMDGRLVGAVAALLAEVSVVCQNKKKFIAFHKILLCTFFLKEWKSPATTRNYFPVESIPLALACLSLLSLLLAR